MITFTNLADSDHSHFAQNLFEEAFPEQERPPFSIIRQRDAGKFHFLVAENGDEPVGKPKTNGLSWEGEKALMTFTTYCATHCDSAS